MKKTVILMVLFAFLLVGTLTYIGLNYEKSVKEYNSLENDIREAAQLYKETNDIEIKLGQTYEVTADALMDASLLEKMSVDDEECEGYAIIKRNLTEYEYNAYIKCDNYTSADYEKN